MRKVLLYSLLTFLLLSTAAFAATERIEFAWDANTETDLTGYRLYMSSTSGQYNYVGKNPSLTPVDAPASYVKSIAKPAVGTTADIVAQEGQKIYFVLTAFDTAGNESGPSNEVSYVFGDPPPAAPKGFWAKFIQVILGWLKFGGLSIKS